MWGATKRHVFANMDDSSIGECHCCCAGRKDRADRSLEVLRCNENCPTRDAVRARVAHVDDYQPWFESSSR